VWHVACIDDRWLKRNNHLTEIKIIMNESNASKTTTANPAAAPVCAAKSTTNAPATVPVLTCSTQPVSPKVSRRQVRKQH
jgi:hypothetical protein